MSSSSPAGPRNSLRAALMALAVEAQSSESCRMLNPFRVPHVTVPLSLGQTAKIALMTSIWASQLWCSSTYSKTGVESVQEKEGLKMVVVGVVVTVVLVVGVVVGVVEVVGVVVCELVTVVV